MQMYSERELAFMKIKTAVCDDEAEMAEELAEKLSGFFAANNMGADIVKFSSGISLLENVGESPDYDVIFLDIKMKAPDGMDTARELRRRNYGGFLIFVTVLEELVFDAFEVSAYDYLVKPLDSGRFEKTMNRLKKSLAENTVQVRKNGETSLVKSEEIVCCEVIDRKLYIHLSNGGTVDFYGKIEELESRLDSRFFKCHRSFLINFAHLKKFCGSCAVMGDGTEVPVSRLRRAAFEEAFEKFMREWKL